MKDIDWSKAPEGATHYSPYKTIHNPFIMLDRGSWYWHNDADWEQYDGGLAPERHLVGVIARPVTPQWNGTGLPPVGVVCEVMSTRAFAGWLEATIVAHDGDKAVYRLGDGRYMADPEFFEVNTARPLFRPIRTPEQIAAEERANQIADMEAIFLSAPPGHGRMAALYDAGYRMTAEDER